MNNRTVKELKLIDLLPSNLKNDPDIAAAAKSIDLGFLELGNITENVLIIPNVDQVSEDVLDHLAYFFHVDFYDLDAEEEVKRKLVKDSIYLHQIKGTPQAVEDLIQTLFGEGTVSEWFEYGDTPYRFRIVTPNEEVTQQRASEFIRALDSVKNLRSTLDRIVIIQREKMEVYFGSVIHEGSKETYLQAGDS